MLNCEGLLVLVGSVYQFCQVVVGGVVLLQLLCGCKLVLFSDDYVSFGVVVFMCVVIEFGVYVVCVCVYNLGEVVGCDLCDMVGLFGQFYDGIECQGLFEVELCQFGCDVGVFVFDGIGSVGYFVQVVVDLMMLQDLQGGCLLEMLSLCFIGEFGSVVECIFDYFCCLFGVVLVVFGIGDVLLLVFVELIVVVLQVGNCYYLLQVVLSSVLF